MGDCTMIHVDGHNFRTLKRGTKVRWPYRGAVGHGEVVKVLKLGKTNADTEYVVREFDHHPGEKDLLHHYGKVLTRE